MSKHAKGKHTQPKAAVIFGKRSTKKDKQSKASADAIASSSEQSQVGAVPTQSAQQAGDDALSKNGAASRPASSSDVSGVDVMVAAPVGASAGAAAQAAEGEAVLPSSEKSILSAMEDLDAKRSRRRKILKTIGISFVAVIIFLAVIYFVGVILFFTHFMPNTHIGNVDVSLQTPEQVQADFERKVQDYTFKVKGNGLNIQITAEEAGLNIDAVAMTDAIAGGQDPWKWPVEVFQTHDASADLADALNATKLSDVVRLAVDQVNATATDPVDAYTAFLPEAGQFSIIPEAGGTKLNYDAVLADIVVGAMNLEPTIIITDKDLIQPAVFKDDPRLVAANDQANAMIAAEIKLTLGGSQVETVGPASIAGWVRVSPDFQVTLDEGALSAWATEFASKLNTVGTRRTYTRPDGKTITVSGGDYGWKVDNAAFAAALTEAVKTNMNGELAIPVLQSGNGFSGVGGQDWGSRYVDVDISAQYARFYDGGKVIWESPIVSGLPKSGRATPQGVYDLNSKAKNITLVGSDTDGDGKPDYETPVTYWMPFKGNSVGFHDANWQSSFGGSRYLSNGSHGCVNLPYSKAESLYGLIKTGDVVVVHS